VADIYTAIAQSIKTEIFYHFKSRFYERALRPVPQEIHAFMNGLSGPFLKMVQHLS
jgi:hypothetical protein